MTKQKQIPIGVIKTNECSQSMSPTFSKVGLSETSMANAYSLLSFKWFCLRHETDILGAGDTYLLQHL
jgi:hypothetical protein